MSDLLEQLRALRSGVGSRPGDDASPDPSPTRDLPTRDVDGLDHPPLEVVLDGRIVPGADGGHVEREEVRSLPTRHGDAPLADGPVHPWTWTWAHARRGGSARSGRRVAVDAVPRPPTGDRVAYVDTETTGLSGGAGTFAFLVGLGRFVRGTFRVVQVLLPGPEHERSQLQALARMLDDVDLVVTYNGASFDVPLLRTRFALHGLADPFERTSHLDLLPLARRWWRDVLPDCRLGTVERAVLGASRSALDVPGAEVPARYVRYLRTGDARPLVGVVQHNVDDVTALAALRTRLERPFGGAPGPLTLDHAALPPLRLEGGRPPIASREQHGIGRWLESSGDDGRALRFYLAAEPWIEEARWDAARVFRRLGAVEGAVERWRSLAEAGDARSWLELAKWLEHRQRDHGAALRAVERARSLGSRGGEDVDRRLKRLRSKVLPQSSDDVAGERD